MTRDYIAEALAIAEGKTILRAERTHVWALAVALCQRMTTEEWIKFRADNPYPQTEPEAEFERRTRGIDARK